MKLVNLSLTSSSWCSRKIFVECNRENKLMRYICCIIEINTSEQISERLSGVFLKHSAHQSMVVFHG